MPLPIRFKARVVAGGHLQVKGRDYDAVYAPVTDFTLTRLMMALPMELSWSMRHIDVTAAFLNGDIDQELFVSHSVNLPIRMKSNAYYSLQKALYRLHQAPLQWYRTLGDALVQELGYVQLASDGTLFKNVTQVNGEEHITIVLVYVDDLLFMSSDQNSCREKVKNS